MSQSVINSREVQRNLSVAMERYHNAFDRVEKLVRQHAAKLGEFPPYVFAVDRLDEDQLKMLPPELASAERSRRRERVALHCLVELVALEQLPGAGWSPPTPLQDPHAKPEQMLAEGEAEGKSGTDLDRFISIMDFARRHGVIYVNGTFEAVEKKNG